jgi:hypothetical protein
LDPASGAPEDGSETLPSRRVVGVVPVLADGAFNTDTVSTQPERLRTLGSVAAPGYMNPEGLIVYHTAAKQLFKVTLDKDDAPKGRVNQGA